MGKDFPWGPGKSTPPRQSASDPPTGETQAQEMDQELKALTIRASGLPLETRETHRLSLLKRRRDVKGLPQALEAARDILAQRLAWLTLTGDLGIGKSHIAMGIAWAWLEVGRHCRYSIVSRLLERLRRTYDLTPEQMWETKEPRFEQVYAWYCGTPLLVLDDLGMEKLTEWALEKLDYLVDYRYLRRLPLVVATNTVIDRLPPRIASRLQDRRLGRVVPLSGPDYRVSG